MVTISRKPTIRLRVESLYTTLCEFDTARPLLANSPITSKILFTIYSVSKQTLSRSLDTVCTYAIVLHIRNTYWNICDCI